MARKPSPPPTNRPLSPLARYMLDFHGIVRLPMIRAEHEAGMPPQMNEKERQMRIDAITEILPRTK